VSRARAKGLSPGQKVPLMDQRGARRMAQDDRGHQSPETALCDRALSSARIAIRTMTSYGIGRKPKLGVSPSLRLPRAFECARKSMAAHSIAELPSRTAVCRSVVSPGFGDAMKLSRRVFLRETKAPR